jgi:hypothetical protein
MVSMLTGYPVQPNKAVVGANAFAHESGIHQHGVLTNRATYEIMDPTEIGYEGSKVVLGKHSGRHAFADALAKVGLAKLEPDALDRAFARFKELAGRKVSLTDVDLEAIVSEELGVTEDAGAFTMESLAVAGGTHLSPTATVRLRRCVRCDRPGDRRGLPPGVVQRLRGERRLRRARRRRRPARRGRQAGHRARRLRRRGRGERAGVPRRDQPSLPTSGRRGCACWVGH